MKAISGTRSRLLWLASPLTLLGCQRLVIDRLVLVEPDSFPRHHLGVFLGRPGIEDHPFVVRPDLSRRQQPLQAIETDRRLGTDGNPLPAGDAVHPFAD